MSAELKVREAPARYLVERALIPVGYKQTEVGVIPEDWEVTPLGSLAEIVSGGTPKTNEQTYWNGTIKWCTPTDITAYAGKYLSETERTISEGGLANSSARLLPKGALLLCSRATIGQIKIADDEISTNQGFKSLICKSSVSNEFLYYKLLTMTAQMLERAIGSTFLEISKKDTASLLLALPPTKAEQEAIAEALSDADALIGSLERLIAKKRKLKQGAMQELLTGKKRLPGFGGEWAEKSLGELFNFSGGLSASREQLSSEGYCYLHYGDIHGSNKTYIDVRAELSDIPKLDVPLGKVSSASLLADGDVVFVDASEDDEGTSKHVVVVNPEGIPFISGLHTIVAKSKTDELACSYRCYCFQTSEVKAQFRFFAVGTKVSGISKTNIAKITLPLPSIEEQTAIAAVLSDMDAEIAALEARLAKARAVKQGMMQELLTGRIRLV